RGLRQAGHSLQQDVPPREQRDQEPRKHVVLADQGLANLRLDPFELIRVLENLILDPLDVDAHRLRSTPPASVSCPWNASPAPLRTARPPAACDNDDGHPWYSHVIWRSVPVGF